MHIGVTAEWLGTQAGGLETYTSELVHALVRVRPDLRLRVYTIRRGQLAELAAAHPRLEARYLGVGSRWTALGAALPYDLVRNRVDLVHVTSVAPLFCPRPSVFTIHDLAYRIHPEFFPRAVQLRLDALISLGIRRARHIIAVSSATRDDLLAHYNVVPERVTVIPEGVSPELSPLPDTADARAGAAAIRARHGLADCYFLYVGRLHVRKNLVRLLQAYAALPAEVRHAHRLVLVGRRLFDSGPVLETIARLDLSGHVVLPGYLPGADLAAVYAGAIAFVYPSLFEGFGLPPLEAMAMGVPVVSSDRHALKEVVADAGLLVDPTDVSALAHAMHRLVAEPDTRATLARAGRARAAAFTWDRTAIATAQVYERAA